MASSRHPTRAVQRLSCEEGSYWDAQLGNDDEAAILMTRAKALLDRADLKRPTFPQLSETAFAPWARESYQLAIEAGYLKGALKTAKSPGSAKVLPDGYSERAEEVAERQGALAGYRLADLLKKLLP